MHTAQKAMDPRGVHRVNRQPAGRQPPPHPTPTPMTAAPYRHEVGGGGDHVFVPLKYVVPALPRRRCPILELGEVDGVGPEAETFWA